MTRRSPFVIELSPEDRVVLEQRARAYTGPHHLVVRAKIALAVHASWLEQIEVSYSILQREVLTPNELTDLDALTERILAFQARDNATTTPLTGASPAPT